jgi:hypothetical protein
VLALPYRMFRSLPPSLEVTGVIDTEDHCAGRIGDDNGRADRDNNGMIDELLREETFSY